MNEREHFNAWRAAITAVLGGSQAYGYDTVPATLPPLYVILSVSRRYAAATRYNGNRSLFHVRLSTRVVGRSEDEARWARQKVAGAVEGRELTIGAARSTGVEFETERDIEYDDGRYHGITTWTYAVARITT